MLYTGEIEWIDSFSPDGRYVVLYLGNDEIVVANRVLANNQAGYSPDGQAEVAIFDLLKNTIVYDLTGNAWKPYGYNPFNLFTPGYNPLPVTWINADTFLVQGVHGNKVQIIQLGDTPHIEADLGEVVAAQLSPDKERILYKTDTQQNRVYTIETGVDLPITQPTLVEDYSIT